MIKRHVSSKNEMPTLGEREEAFVRPEDGANGFTPSFQREPPIQNIRGE